MVLSAHERGRIRAFWISRETACVGGLSALMARVMEDSAHIGNSKSLFETHKGSEGAHVMQVDATLATRKAQISAADMATLRSRLPSELSARCPDQMINQFLRATDRNISQVLVLTGSLYCQLVLLYAEVHCARIVTAGTSLAKL